MAPTPSLARACSPAALCVCAVVFAASLIAIAHCQNSDVDESFEFEHQDIGRLSGLSSGTSPVAPQTTIVTRQQPQPSAGPVEVPSALAAPAFERSPVKAAPAAGSRASGAGQQRKPKRVTLVARRDPGPLGAAPQQPLVPVQLPAPQSQLQTVPTAFDLAPPTLAPQLIQTTVSSPTALSSFRATGGSVSARHSALIAQVAAERASAASLIPAQSEPAALDSAGAGSFGSSGAASFGSLGHQSAPEPQPSTFASFAPAAPQHEHQAHQAASSQAQASLAPGPADEPEVAPSFEHVLGHGCPQKGVFSWENREHCDRYYMCTNGTFTEEACPNGLAYSKLGAVYQHCAYNWNVDCGKKKSAEPIASPGCPWQFGIFPIVQNGRCSIDYYACEWGVPDTKRCTPEGLFYDDRIKGCQWADQLGCKSEGLLNFKCPAEDEDNPYWPYPRYYHTTSSVIVCVNEQPRLVHCDPEQAVHTSSLACVDLDSKKKKKKHQQQHHH